MSIKFNSVWRYINNQNLGNLEKYVIYFKLISNSALEYEVSFCTSSFCHSFCTSNTIIETTWMTIIQTRPLEKIPLAQQPSNLTRNCKRKVNYSKTFRISQSLMLITYQTSSWEINQHKVSDNYVRSGHKVVTNCDQRQDIQVSFFFEFF